MNFVAFGKIQPSKSAKIIIFSLYRFIKMADFAHVENLNFEFLQFLKAEIH